MKVWVFFLGSFLTKINSLKTTVCDKNPEANTRILRIKRVDVNFDPAPGDREVTWVMMQHPQSR